jgi:hypothetical protein
MAISTLPIELRPLVLLEKLEKKSRSKAEHSLLMAINDIVEMTCRWLPQRVFEVDKELSLVGLPTLSTLRKKYSKVYRKVIKRGQIISEVEYYFLKGIRDSNVAEDAKEEAQIDFLLEDYLQRI